MNAIRARGMILARRPQAWLIFVAVAHALSPLLVLGLRWPFGPDETVYLSQLNGHAPALYFSAPRAVGSTLLAAPVTAVTSSVAAVRVWVTLLSGLGMWLGFRPWLRVVGGWVVPTAAAAFATLWTTTLYGFEVMPNEWVAFASVGACGALLGWLRDGQRRHLVSVGLALAVIGLLRPSDAAYAMVGLAVPTLFVDGSRRAKILAVATMAFGFAAGVSEWLVEAELRYGGVAARVHAAQAEQGGSGLFWSGGAQARALAGPLLCRAGCHADAGALYRAWWVLAGGLAVVAVIGTVRRGRGRDVVLVPTVAGLVVAMQYLVTVPYAAPRFLLPAYALLSVPVVLGGREVVRSLRRRSWQRSGAVVLAAALVVNALLQVDVLRTNVVPAVDAYARLVSRDAAALRRAGVRPSCAVVGDASINLQLSFALRCANGPMSSAVLRDPDGTDVVWLRRHRPPQALGSSWRSVSLASYTAWVEG